MSHFAQWSRRWREPGRAAARGAPRIRSSLVLTTSGKPGVWIQRSIISSIESASLDVYCISFCEPSPAGTRASRGAHKTYDAACAHACPTRLASVGGRAGREGAARALGAARNARTHHEEADLALAQHTQLDRFLDQTLSARRGGGAAGRRPSGVTAVVAVASGARVKGRAQANAAQMEGSARPQPS